MGGGEAPTAQELQLEAEPEPEVTPEVEETPEDTLATTPVEDTYYVADMAAAQSTWDP